MKTCRKCEDSKPVTEFGKNRTTKDGLQHWCKPCNKAAVYKWREENPDRQRKNSREHARKWRAENPDKFREQHRRHMAAYRERHGQPYRIRKAGVARETYVRADVFARYGGMCAYCDSPAEHIDHVVPISKGGPDAEHNLLPACAPCNLSKNAKSLAEWAETF